MTQSLPLFRRRIVCGSLLAVLALVAVPAAGADDKAPAAAATAQSTGDKIDAMLKGLGYFYQRIETPGQPTMFKVMIQDNQNRSSLIILKVVTWGWKYNDGTVVESIYGYSQLLSTPKLSAAVAAKVAEFNDGLTLNACSINPETGLYVYSGFYARGLDSESLSGYVINLHYTGQTAKELVEPIIKAEAAEK